jgi:hypothetical protein
MDRLIAILVILLFVLDILYVIERRKDGREPAGILSLPKVVLIILFILLFYLGFCPGVR